MNVSRKVLDAVGMYIQWREAEIRARMIYDQLSVLAAYLDKSEGQTYEHVIGLYEIGQGISETPKQPQQPDTRQFPLVMTED
jgi:hypothetical protein